jgi:TetR/AcrR family transcriptional regulator, regulator of cefoperazone and chloramphenicol sensitivity
MSQTKATEVIHPGAIALRDAALELFGEAGYERTSVRAIAERANVSPGLLTYHFGSKERLRAEVERFVIAAISESFADLVAAPAADADSAEVRLSGFYMMFRHNPAIARYLRRSLLEESEASMALFSRLLRLSIRSLDAKRAEGLLQPSSNGQLQAVIAMGSGLLSLLIPRHIEHGTGISMSSEDGLRRWLEAEHEFLTRGLFKVDTQTATERDVSSG